MDRVGDGGGRILEPFDPSGVSGSGTDSARWCGCNEELATSRKLSFGDAPGASTATLALRADNTVAEDVVELSEVRGTEGADKGGASSFPCASDDALGRDGG